MPKKVGGRYSVLSPVGLFPLAVLGVDIKKLLDGAAHMRAQCLKPAHENPAILRAAILANAWDQGRTIADNFYFKTDFESVGKWYRQLMGESIGKEWNREHTHQVWMGMTPTVSIGSTDLHSMAQLYFGGPNDKLFTIITVKNTAAVKVPSMPEFEPLVHNIQGKRLSAIMEAIVGGVKVTLEKENRPYCSIELADAAEESIGALLQLHMMEMMYLAALLDVNPFDQPNVESYKVETKRILARKRN
jgi:glucose-6-phosphate isomerase